MYKNHRGSLLDRLSMNSEPIETRVLRMAPVGENPKLHYLESSVRSFLKSKGEGSHLIHRNNPGPITSPTLTSESRQPCQKLSVSVNSITYHRTQSSGKTELLTSQIYFLHQEQDAYVQNKICTTKAHLGRARKLGFHFSQGLTPTCTRAALSCPPDRRNPQVPGSHVSPYQNMEHLE